MRILTNMRFWQSETWTQNTVSIYPGHRLPLGRKPLPPLREALELCRRGSDFDVVVTMGARESLYYGLFCLLRGKPSKQIACELFLDDPQPHNPFWRLKNYGYSLVARRMLGLLTNSTAEIDLAIRRLGLDRSRIRYVPLHTNISYPQHSNLDDGFVLSAGATRRDFATLLQAAEQVSFPIVIVCRKDQLLPSHIPHNVTVYRALPRDQYLDLVKRCSFAVVSLLPAERATGQVAILEAMAFGKPVIATQTAGALDLIEHDVNGLFIPPFEPTALAAAIRRLAEDPALRRRMGSAALETVLRDHTIETHAARKLEAIQDLYNQHRTLR